MEQLLSETIVCHHCQDPCDESIGEEHHFCCYGCKAVFELLEANNLAGHFEETSLQNKSISDLKAERKYAFLENADAQKELLSFHDDQTSVIRFSAPAIHCSSCIFLLEHLQNFHADILRSEVHFGKKEVTITYNSSLSLKQIAILLSQLGYPPQVSLQSLDKTKKHVTKSYLGTKIAVAGFCFGNSMLMSMPDYLDSRLLITPAFQTLFNWINFAFAFPAMFYAGKDYFLSAWKGFLYKNLNVDIPISIGILTLFARSAYEIFSQTGTGYFDSLTGLIFFLLIGKWYQSKTYQALSFERDYTSYFPISVACLIDGQEYQRALKELKKGDIVIIHNDELIPADGTILKGTANIDYSFVTGESKTVIKEIGSFVYAGGRQKGGELHITLSESVNNSELTQLWNKDVFREKDKNFQNLVDRLSAYFTAAILIIAAASALYWWIVDKALVWNTVSAVLIVACPCALALVLPFAYGHSMRILGKNGLFLKHAEVVETMSKVKKIIFDKTGTLTKSASNVEYHGETLAHSEWSLLKSALGNSAHPLSRVIYQNLDQYNKAFIRDFQEVTGSGFSATNGEVSIKVGSNKFVNGLEDSDQKASLVYIRVGDKEGFFSIENQYRSGIFEMLKKLKRKFSLALLSGDNDAEKARLSSYFEEMRFQQQPSNKYDFLASETEKTMMIGDGLNDAGALKKASVGIAISDDIHQFSPACDAILHSQSTTSLANMIAYTQSVRSIVLIAFGLSFLYNILGLSFAVSGNLTPLVSAILMPLSSVTVVGFITFCVTWKGRSLHK